MIAISTDISSRKLLLVEDDPAFQRLVVQYLDPLFNIAVADNGAQAARLVTDCQPDVAIVDMHLPCISGAEFIQIIRNDPELANTPVLVMSSDTGLDNIFTAINAGSDEFIRKRDVSQKSLLAAIDRISPPQ